MTLNVTATGRRAEDIKIPETKTVTLDFQPFIVSEGSKVTTPDTWPAPPDQTIKINIDPDKIEK